MDQLFTLLQIVEGAWEFANLHSTILPVYMCFVDLEKAYNRVPQVILWEVLREYGVLGLLLRAIRSLYSRNDVVLLVESHGCLQRSLERFAAECEAVGMRISTSKSESMVLAWKRMACPLQVREKDLPYVEEFKDLGVLFTSDGKRDREIGHRQDRRQQ
ncbi:hypothetical protein AOLI_G00098990 [Acnodon oligacanthus]